MSEDQFTSGEDYQHKVLAFMLSNPEFRDIARDSLAKEDFANKAIQWFFDTIGNAPIALTNVTLQEEMLRAVKEKRIKADEIDKFVNTYQLVSMRPLPMEEDYIKTDLSRFIKTQATKRAILGSFDLIQKGQWGDVLDSIQTAINSGIDITNKGQDYFGDFEARLDRRSNETISAKLSTGIPELDEMMNGGLKKKQLGLVAGGTGRGKSIFLEWLGRVGVLMNEPVVYYTLELPEDEIAARYDSLFARIKINELRDNHAQAHAALLPYANRFGSKLIIKEYPAASISLATIKAHLRLLNSAGIRPGLIIVDYLDLLKSTRSYSARHEELDAITQELHGLAKELDTRVWTATQLNRSGITAETPDETSVSGALAKLFTADVSLFLAQTNDERQDERMRIVVAKNRNGITGRTVTIDTDYAYMTFYRSSVV